MTKKEIDLMNRIKAKGAELLILQAELAESIVKRKEELLVLLENPVGYHDYVIGDARDELAQLEATEPYRWAEIGRTDIQTGIMALIRAVEKS